MPLDLTPKIMPYYELDNTSPPSLITGLRYLAKITQTGTNNPTAIESPSNTITGITYSRGGVGAYFINGTDKFPANKTFILLGASNSAFDNYIRCYQNSTSQITLESYAGAAADGIITDMSIMIITTP